MRAIRVSACALMFAVSVGGRSLSADLSPSAAPASPNEALASLAKEIILESLPPEFEKKKDWGRQKQIFGGYHWVYRGDHWHFDERKELVNDGLWRMYRARLINPEKNLHVQISQPRAAGTGRTAFQVFLTARLWTEARQERWVLGVKGLNFHVEAEATVQARLDIEVGVRPAATGGFGSIEIMPKVTNVDLQLDDLSLKQVGVIGGDLAQELGNAWRGVIENELRDREPDVKKKINAAIAKRRDKLCLSPAQIANLGWDKIKALLGATQ